MRLSEELQQEAAAQREQYEQALTRGTLSERSPAAMQWRPAILLAAAASAAALLLCALLPPLTMMAWLAPLPVLLLYRMRFPQTLLTPLAGARVGAAVGLFCSAGAAAAGTAWLAIRRFGLHRLHGFDALYTGALAAAQKQAIAQNGPEAAASFPLLATPEFRAGMLLLFAACAAVVFMLLCTACGALVAALGRPRAARQQG